MPSLLAYVVESNGFLFDSDAFLVFIHQVGISTKYKIIRMKGGASMGSVVTSRQNFQCLTPVGGDLSLSFCQVLHHITARGALILTGEMPSRLQEPQPMQIDKYTIPRSETSS